MSNRIKYIIMGLCLFSSLIPLASGWGLLAFMVLCMTYYIIADATFSKHTYYWICFPLMVGLSAVSIFFVPLLGRIPSEFNMLSAFILAASTLSIAAVNFWRWWFMNAQIENANRP